jgi:hypothetical protein
VFVHLLTTGRQLLACCHSHLELHLLSTVYSFVDAIRNWNDDEGFAAILHVQPNAKYILSDKVNYWVNLS